MSTTIIVGNGPAGFYTAKKLREYDPSMRVIIFDRSPLPFYTKIRLPDFIAGKVPLEKLFLAGPETYEKAGIETCLGQAVVDVDLKRRSLRGADGEELSWDNLIIASGAKAAHPPDARGLESEGVFTLRNIGDAQCLTEKIASSKTAIVIGGGLLGLELAHALLLRGLKVTVLEFCPILLPRQLKEAEARILQDEMEKMGFSFLLGHCTDSIAKLEKGLRVHTKNGEALEADLVVVSTGIAPDVSLAAQMGLQIEKAILVNDRLESSQPGVYAIGDCVQHKGVIYGLWAAAKEQGETLAGIICGRSGEYKGSSFDPVLKVTGIQLAEIRARASAGNVST
ncbi:MAG: hypothetical protein A2X49_03830 [Lentisphaerae bacterium GWF2_52_8]|nr:MAG: hypothetical protein A2X49_03830 [Lentisphaerae bacterium GWF2_52_8]